MEDIFLSLITPHRKLIWKSEDVQMRDRRRKVSLEWIGIILAVMGLLIALVSYLQASRNQKRQTIIEVEATLREAFELLGGHGATITSYNPDRGDLEKARHLIEEQALLLMPEYEKSYRYLGAYYTAVGNHEKALEASSRAVDLDPRSARAHTNLGGDLQQFGRLNEAASAYQRAIELDPELAIAHRGLGLVLMLQGDNDGSIKAFRRSLEIDGTHESARKHLDALLAESTPHESNPETPLSSHSARSN